MRIFRLSKAWPAEERYELTGQIRRSSRSVCACTAEAWRKRRYPAAFVAKLNDAEAEAAETRVWLDFALACGYLERGEHARLDRTYETLLAQLVRMIQQADRWSLRPRSPRPRNETKPASRNELSATRSDPPSPGSTPSG